MVLGCETGFTLLAIPVLGRHGPWGVSVHTTWMAAVIFAGLGLVHEGPAAITRLDRADWLAIGYLAVAVTAVAFVLWYSSVARLGAARAEEARAVGAALPVAALIARTRGALLGLPAGA